MQRRDFAARFVLEMSLARAVDHPCVCRVLDYGRSGTGYYSAMEFMPGEPLSENSVPRACEIPRCVHPA